jgi:hypothetical protein
MFIKSRTICLSLIIKGRINVIKKAFLGLIAGARKRCSSYYLTIKYRQEIAKV